MRLALRLRVIRLPARKGALRILEHKYSLLPKRVQAFEHLTVGGAGDKNSLASAVQCVAFRHTVSLPHAHQRPRAPDGFARARIVQKGVRAQAERRRDAPAEFGRAHPKCGGLGHHLQLVRVGDKVGARLEGHAHARRRTRVDAARDDLGQLGAVA
eukprot:4468246-Pleurochrysis_carterae.AAC.1